MLRNLAKKKKQSGYKSKVSQFLDQNSVDIIKANNVFFKITGFEAETILCIIIESILKSG